MQFLGYVYAPHTNNSSLLTVFNTLLIINTVIIVYFTLCFAHKILIGITLQTCTMTLR